MIGGLKPRKLLYRDGTAQAQRFMEALNPDYIHIDERSIGDLLLFAQDYARALRFFDEENKPAGNWEAFLIDDITAYRKAGADTSALRKQWIADALKYIDHPDSFAGDTGKSRKLSGPHLALFIAFLQLLGYIQDQLNGFTKRHLDFYYREVLGLGKKKSIPDVVHVIIELAGDAHEFFLEQGTLLSAGKDSLGKDLIYKTEKDTLISAAQIQDIKTLFIDKRVYTIKSTRADNHGDPDAGFTKMMESALGDPLPGDKLPALPFGEAADLTAIYNNLRGTDEAKKSVALDYIQNKLFLSETDFTALISIKIKIANKDRIIDEEWEKAYAILEEAYKNKIIGGRQQALKAIRSSKDGGFLAMLQFALGDPAALYSLPDYRSKTISMDVLKKINKDLDIPDAKAAALAYITGELQLSEDDFRFIIKTFEDDDRATLISWNKVYAIIERAQRKASNYVLPAPVREDRLNIYAISNARGSAYRLEGEQGESGLRFNTFGKGYAAKNLTGANPAAIGFAVSSPGLLLAEGLRTITLTLRFENKGVRVDEIIDKLPGSIKPVQPFLFFLSNQKAQIKPSGFTYGDFIINTGAGEEYSATLEKGIITKGSTGSDFTELDKGKYIVLADGNIYLIKSVTKTEATVDHVGKTAAGFPVVKKYNPADVYVNALQFRLVLSESAPPVIAVPGAADEYTGIESEFPVLAVMLNQAITGGAANHIGIYQLFKNLRLEKVQVATEVKHIKALTLQNDDSVLNYKKPFEPFGYQPQAGSSLYFAHPEISSRRLDTLTLNLEWMNPPVDFSDYYANYWEIKEKNSAVDKSKYEIKRNTDFRAQLWLIDNGVPIDLKVISLFDANNSSVKNIIPIAVNAIVAQPLPAYHYSSMELPSAQEEVVNWKRYFRLELDAPDFQHNAYAALLTKQAFLFDDPQKPTAEEIKLRQLVLNPPYTPKLKSLTLDYTASFDINLVENTAREDDRIFHISAFGYKEPDIKEGSSYFLPYFGNGGELYLGLTKLAAPQNLSILFQMAEGSADPDLTPEPVTWSYLTGNQWRLLAGSDILSDTTNGLLNTGIIEFAIPEDITGSNTLLAEGLYWLRAGVCGNTGAVPDTVDIITQGISAVFADHENAADHLLTLLPPESIQEPVDTIPEIKKIIQPYTSSKGKPPEEDRLFYNRVSERLRHKNRALTLWDYERIVLEGFPQIYKAKCIPATFSGSPGSAGGVDIIVIPDIRGSHPFHPFQPKVSADIIYQIKKYLERRMPAYAAVAVKNPDYVQVKIRTTIKIKKGYDVGFFREKLNDELKRYLTPWAYDEGADITLGGKLYANVMVNFIAERPYVDYVAGIKLFQIKEGIPYDVLLNTGENVVRAEKPDVVLVSALDHVIDIVVADAFKKDDFTGIGYMKIELDFIVAP